MPLSHSSTLPLLGRNACRQCKAASPSAPLRPTNQARSRTATTNTQTATAARVSSSLHTSRLVHPRVASQSHGLYTIVPPAHRFPAFTRSFSASPRLSETPRQVDSSLSSSLRSSPFASTYRPPTRSAVGSWTSVLIVGVATGAAYIFHAFTKQTSASEEDEDDELAHLVEDYIHTNYTKMTGEILPGRPGTLTPEQDAKLREFWIEVLKVFGVLDQQQAHALKANLVGLTRKATTQSVESSKKEKKKHGWFSRSSTHSEDKGGASAVDEDKYGQTAQFKHALANMSPETLRAAFWSMVKHDHPDGLLLRFLRARKWDVEKALVMMVSTMHWRAVDVHVDDDVMVNAEESMWIRSQSTDPKEKKWGQDFLDQMRMGKSYLHGSDLQGRPMCFIRVRLHHAGDQSEAAQERYTVYVIETSRLLLNPPVDTACVVFDMTDFSLSNMDYAPVKFMIKAFEANYPESLGVVLIHKAPWIFNAIWKIIRGLLDPVVAAKVHFTNNSEDLKAFIDLKKLPKEHGGEEDYEFTYMEPVVGENDRMKDTAAKQQILDARKTIVDEYEKKTIAWIENSTDLSLQNSRQSLRDQLRANYWQLDPYVRARSHYDRAKNIEPNGAVDWFQGEKMHHGVDLGNTTASVAQAQAVSPSPATNGHAVQTSADDLD